MKGIDQRPRDRSPRYVVPTSLGCYGLLNETWDGWIKAVLSHVLSRPESPRWSRAWMDELCGRFEWEGKQAERRVKWLVQRGYLELVKTSIGVPSGGVSEAVEDLLLRWSPRGQAALIDRRGLCIAMVGFSPKVVDALAALSSKLMGALEHEGETLSEVLGLRHAVPCVVDARGHHPVCFFEFHVGPECLTAVVVGPPRFSDASFRDLTWLLWRRYGCEDQGRATG